MIYISSQTINTMQWFAVNRLLIVLNGHAKTPDVLAWPFKTINFNASTMTRWQPG